MTGPTISLSFTCDTASFQDGIDDTLVNFKGILRHLLEEGLIAASANVSHLFQSGIGVDKVAFGDKVATNLFLAGRRQGAHGTESLEPISLCRGRAIEVVVINSIISLEA